MSSRGNELQNLHFTFFLGGGPTLGFIFCDVIIAACGHLDVCPSRHLLIRFFLRMKPICRITSNLRRAHFSQFSELKIKIRRKFEAQYFDRRNSQNVISLEEQVTR
jgi:hypothetical protein